jgi:hypothetical protein
LTQTDVNHNISRLVDSQRQVEISFYNTPDRFNTELPAAFPVVGMPKTFLLFPPNTPDHLYRIYKNVFIICKDPVKANSDLCKEIVKDKWHERHQQKRSIRSDVKFLRNEEEESEEGRRLYSISYAWGTITLMDEVNSEDDDSVNGSGATEKLYMFYTPSIQYDWMDLYRKPTLKKKESEETKFEYLVDRTIRIQNTSSCMVREGSKITFRNCQEQSDRWIFDENTKQIISEEDVQCLSAISLYTGFYLSHENCDLNNRMQKWVVQFINRNQDIIENNPEISITNMQEWRLEESNAVTTTINSPIFGGLLKVNQGKKNIVWDLINWGLLRSKDSNYTKCVTNHGFGEALTLEKCDTNWTQCQETLQIHISSIDPLVQTQTSVANCSGKADVRQALEYASDFTIRPFNTNLCVKANSTMLVLEECAETSSIWGTFNHTGQLPY